MAVAMEATGPLEEKLAACNDLVALGLAAVAAVVVAEGRARPHEVAAAPTADVAAAVVCARC